MLEKSKVLGKLDNGMRYYIYNNNIKNKMRFILLSKAGSLNDGESKNGLSHLTEHMCLSYKILNEREAKSNYSNLIDTREYSFSGYTDFDRTVLRIYRKYETSNLKKDFNIIRNIIDKEVFKEEFLDKVKSDVIEECEYHKNKNKIQRKIVEFITDGRIKGLPMGTPELIENITIEDLLEFYNKNCTFDKGAIIVSGDIDVIEVEKMISDTFNSRKSIVRTDNEGQKNIISYLKNEILVLEDIENNYNAVQIYYRFIFENSNLKKRLIRYFFDRMLENYIKKKFELNNINIIEVGCTDKKNIGDSDYFIVIYKTDSIEDTNNVYMNAIGKLVQNGFKEIEFKEQLEILQKILKEIVTNKDQTLTEEICEEYIKNFFDNEAILLIKEDYNEIVKIIAEIDINDINNLVENILNGYCKIVEIRGNR